jgi:hypothetical protein
MPTPMRASASSTVLRAVPDHAVKVLHKAKQTARIVRREARSASRAIGSPATA